VVAAVSARHRVPHVAVWISVAAALVIALWGDAYAVITALSTVALYLSYAIPIGCALRARRRGQAPAPGPLELGAAFAPLALLALAFVAVMLVILVLPPFERTGIALLFAAAAVALARLRRRDAARVTATVVKERR
jgi:amino acid transporter